MENRRVRIFDIAEELGVSTATVSNVIHGKTRKISEETVKRVQQLLEKRQYMPGVASVLLAQNNSRIIGTVIYDHEKYEGHILEDPFISASVNALEKEINRLGKFLMLKVTNRWDDIPKFASMWNMDGLVLIGFCTRNYQKLREQMHIPFVVYDGYMEGSGNLVNITIDHFGGGVQAGRYLKSLGHLDVLCIADNTICMDQQRFMGLKSELPNAQRMVVPMEQKARVSFYKAHLADIIKYSAAFVVSDYYAMEFLQFLLEAGISVPENMSVVGFDNVRQCEKTIPPLTTIKQDFEARATCALKTLKQLKEGGYTGKSILLDVSLEERASACDVNMHKKALRFL